MEFFFGIDDFENFIRIDNFINQKLFRTKRPIGLGSIYT